MPDSNERQLLGERHSDIMVIDGASGVPAKPRAEQHFCGGGLSLDAAPTPLRQLLERPEAPPDGERLAELLARA
eukprot:4624154-Pyramimonas_sp.AAC.1